MDGPTRLQPEHDPAAFQCADATSLQDWLRNTALDAGKRGSAQTHVLLNDGRIAGYFSLSAHAVSPGELPKKVARTSRATWTAVLLGRLAVDGRDRGMGLGRRLVREALQLVGRLSEELGIQLVVVDAINERAQSLYSQYKFVPMEPEAAGYPNRMFLKTSAFRKPQGAAI